MPTRTDDLLITKSTGRRPLGAAHRFFGLFSQVVRSLSAAKSAEIRADWGQDWGQVLSGQSAHQRR